MLHLVYVVFHDHQLHESTVDCVTSELQNYASAVLSEGYESIVSQYCCWYSLYCQPWWGHSAAIITSCLRWSYVVECNRMIYSDVIKHICIKTLTVIVVLYSSTQAIVAIHIIHVAWDISPAVWCLMLTVADGILCLFGFMMMVSDLLCIVNVQFMTESEQDKMHQVSH